MIFILIWLIILRLIAGDKIIIQPDLEFAVKNMENWNKLEFENTSKRLVTYIRMKNISKNVIQLANGDNFGIVQLKVS